MKDILLWPLLCGGLVVGILFGSYRGTAVRDDFTWMLGGLVAIVLSLLLNRLARLEQRVDELGHRNSAERSE